MSKIPLEVIERYNELKDKISVKPENTVSLKEKNQAKNLLKKIEEKRMPDFKAELDDVYVSISDVLKSCISDFGDARKKGDFSFERKQIKAIEILYPEIKE